MTWSAKEAHQIGRMEGTLDGIKDSLAMQEPRVSKLEEFQNRAKGALKVIGVALSIGASIVAAILISGCATAKTHCTYDDKGKVKTQWSRSTVIGKGDTDMTIEACIGILFETSDTGISNNAVKVVEKAVEAGVKAALPTP